MPVQNSIVNSKACIFFKVPHREEERIINANLVSSLWSWRRVQIVHARNDSWMRITETFQSPSTCGCTAVHGGHGNENSVPGVHAKDFRKLTEVKRSVPIETLCLYECKLGWLTLTSMLKFVPVSLEHLAAVNIRDCSIWMRGNQSWQSWQSYSS